MVALFYLLVYMRREYGNESETIRGGRARPWLARIIADQWRQWKSKRLGHFKMTGPYCWSKNS